MNLRSSRYSKLVGWVFVVAGYGYLIRLLSRDANNLDWRLFQFRGKFFLLSMVLYCSYLLFKSLIWYYITDSNDTSVSFLSTVRIYISSFLGRYLPGKVFVAASRITAYKHLGKHRRLILACYIQENVTIFLAAALIFSCSLWFVEETEIRKLLPFCGAFVIVGLIGLYPRFLEYGINTLFSLTGQDPLKLEMRYPRLLGAVVLNGIAWIIASGAFLAFVLSITEIEGTDYPLVAGSFPMAVFIGFISIFAPAGLGVREAVLSSFLAHTMAPAVAAVVGIAARPWAVCCEALVITGVLALTPGLSEQQKK